MMTPRETLERIAELLERGMEASDQRDRYALMAAAHTHAVIQASTLRKHEAYAQRMAAQYRGEALH